MSVDSSIPSQREQTVGKTSIAKGFSPTSTFQDRHMHQSTQTLYQVTQQVKFLHLQAEVESLLQQLQIMKQQRLAAASHEDSN
ncbi:MAG: hypothetical protein JOZ78_24145 [Chroococcidiopsidaceae cyanobacterium CP_BM_ER_R8_30]|nr:hypothetical protein [Chroococcidiopsidaceae cyanobacterium CP_BM_ER_R8_30]